MTSVRPSGRAPRWRAPVARRQRRRPATPVRAARPLRRRVVEAVSHSPYWKDTAIFITEDDAQDGPDHVDAHRTTALVISPYTQTGKVDSTQYSTVAMMRTMELLAGIGPLTQ
jgi:hypothetical protein